ncbi:FG-GAP repeat domain-containing protein [Salininema proteolyticum]|uniref:FG-GAP repeat domain-containing protein n=1 Tax=Salininema proteolyticum TaxID=1607685 RepID=A0ABV8U332_9ACTN
MASLQVPSVAAAEDPPAVDCDQKAADGFAESTFEAAATVAAACDTDVEITGDRTGYSAVSVTPDGFIHMEQAAEAAYPSRLGYHYDPTLERFDGILRATMPNDYMDPEFSDGGTNRIVDMSWRFFAEWGTELPKPTVDGSSATYSGIAPGLDLTVDLDAASFSMVFQAETREAAAALNDGLRIRPDGGKSAEVSGTSAIDIKLPDSDTPLVSSTPFTAWEAEGAGTPALPVTVAGTEDGSLALSLDDSFLDDPGTEYPLSVSADWYDYERGPNYWGSVSSAVPDSALLKGESGRAAPHYAGNPGAGDAGAGHYCDTVASADCTQLAAQAETYWDFSLDDLLDRSHPSGDWQKFSVDEATFTIDQTHSASCENGDAVLRRSAEFDSGATWNSKPALLEGESRISSADHGENCGGTAAVGFDVAAFVTDAQTAGDESVSFAMTAPDGEPSSWNQFDGGSARLSVYYRLTDAYFSTATGSYCAHSPESASWHRSFQVEFQFFSEQTWPLPPQDAGLTWNAILYDSESGEAVHTTEPLPVAVGEYESNKTSPPDSFTPPDGKYFWEIAVTSPLAENEPWISDPCYVNLDDTAPVIESVTVDDPHPSLGDTVTVTVKASDAAGGNESLESIHYGVNAGDGDHESGRIFFEGGDTVSFPVAFDDHARRAIWIDVMDKAENTTYRELPVMRAEQPQWDFDEDHTPDLYASKDSDGTLYLYKGNGSGGFQPREHVGSGWNSMNAFITAGDFDEDGHSDVLGRRESDGALFLYKGNGDGTFKDRLQIGSGWNAMEFIVSAGDFDGDGHMDVVASRKSNGYLYLYSGNGTGAFRSTVKIGSGWGSMNALVSPGDFDHDGHYDLIARRASDGKVFFYRGHGDGTFDDRVEIASGWNGYGQIASIGDFDRDGELDLLAVSESEGRLYLYRGNGGGTLSGVPKAYGTGWNAMNLPE